MANYRGFTGTNLFLAPNAPNGVVLDYFAKEAGPARITVADSTGKQIRTINARAEAGVINRVTWDMRTDSPIPPAGRGAAAAAGGGGRGGRGGGRGGRGGQVGEAAAPPAAEAAGTTPPAQEGGEIQNEFGGPGGAAGAAGAGGGGGGGGRFGGGGRGGAIVDPGDFTVTVTVAGKSDSHAVKVEEDPRVQFSDSDRARRRKAVDTLISMTKEADGGRRRAVAMTTALTNLTDSWKQPNSPQVPDAVKKAADDLLAKAKKVAATFESAGGGRGAGGGSAGPPPAYTPPPVTQKISRLMFSIDGYSAAPTATQMTEIDECSAQLKKGLEEVNALWDEVPKLNKLMADNGVQYFTVNPNTVPAPTGGRGGGN